MKKKILFIALGLFIMHERCLASFLPYISGIDKNELGFPTCEIIENSLVHYIPSLVFGFLLLYYYVLRLKFPLPKKNIAIGFFSIIIIALSVLVFITNKESYSNYVIALITVIIPIFFIAYISNVVLDLKWSSLDRIEYLTVKYNPVILAYLAIMCIAYWGCSRQTETDINDAHLDIENKVDEFFESNDFVVVNYMLGAPTKVFTYKCPEIPYCLDLPLPSYIAPNKSRSLYTISFLSDLQEDWTMIIFERTKKYTTLDFWVYEVKPFGYIPYDGEMKKNDVVEFFYNYFTKGMGNTKLINLNQGDKEEILDFSKLRNEFWYAGRVEDKGTLRHYLYSEGGIGIKSIVPQYSADYYYYTEKIIKTYKIMPSVSAIKKHYNDMKRMVYLIISILFVSVIIAIKTRQFSIK